MPVMLLMVLGVVVVCDDGGCVDVDVGFGIGGVCIAVVVVVLPVSVLGVLCMMAVALASVWMMLCLL